MSESQCWCGAEGDLYYGDPDGPPCGGLGTLYCYCGGDFCACHNHGEVECPGCEECEEGDDW